MTAELVTYSKGYTGKEGFQIIYLLISPCITDMYQHRQNYGSILILS